MRLVGCFTAGRTQWSSFDGARIQAAFLLPGGENVAHTIMGLAMVDESDHSSDQEDEATPLKLLWPLIALKEVSLGGHLFGLRG